MEGLMRMTEKPNRFYSKRQETKGNAYLGLKNTKNSGATAFDKGDGKDQYLLMEWKTLTTSQKSRVIHKEWFTKNEEEAFARGKELSAVGFDFGDGENYICVSMRDFKMLYDAWREEQEKHE